MAHLHLAGDDDALIVGQVMADFLEPGWRESTPPQVQVGIRQHQAIDQYTDAHPVVHRSKHRIVDSYGLYAGILIDIFYDHFLAQHWPKYRPGERLEDFAQRMYRALERNYHLLTDRLRTALPWMVGEDWLTGYREIAGVDRTLQGISQRFRRANPVATGASALLTHWDGLEADFLEFFPQLEAFHLRQSAACGQNVEP